MNQESIALMIVGIAGVSGSLWVLKGLFAGPCSRWLLKHHYIKMAMWLRGKGNARPGCSACVSSCNRSLRVH